MRLYNTLTRQIDELDPIQKGEIKLYACGLTVYDYTHIGHLRKYSLDDVLVRTLRHTGLKVTFVQNVTDVGHLASDADTGEDKLEKGAKKYGKTVWDIAHEFEDYFFRSMDLMGNLRPDVSCRATEHIPEQIALVQKLEEKGFTYVIEGDGVYFDTSKFPTYGELAKLNLDEQKAGARVDVVPGKRNPADFALWKFERPGENRAMSWESPWAKRGFPGWHIECSAMAMKYLGEQFDIHTGGIDHVPVHHTNEIAQAEAATGKHPFVKYWVHHNHLQVNGEKMSKSLGNFFTIDDVLQKGFSPQALRLLFLTGHYRSQMNFTWENLEGAEKSWQKLARMMVSFREETDRQMLSEEKLKKLDEYRSRFFSYMEDDLKTPEAVAVMYEVMKSNVPSTDKYDLLRDFDEVLGLGLAKLTPESLAAAAPKTSVSPELQALLDQRQAAREAKDWKLADELRQKILTAGFEVLDTAGGQQLQPK